MNTFALPENLGRAIMDYLANRPYKEVASLIGAISELSKVEQNQPDPDLKDEAGAGKTTKR